MRRMKKMKDETVLALAAMVCGLVFGMFCVWQGIDHAIAFAVAAGIFGVAGYELKAWRESRAKGGDT